MLELGLRIVGEAGVDRPGLDDRARGRDEPVEALGRPAARRSGRRPASPAAIRSIVWSARDGRRVAVGRERGEQRLVELRAGAEEPQRAAEEHDAGVDGLAALDPRDDAQRRVLEGLRAGTLGLLGQLARRLQPPRQELGVRVAVGPLGRHERRRGGVGRAAASRSSAAAIEPAAGSSTWSRIAGKAPRARASGSAPWNAYSAAPWSISHRLPCQRSRFGLRGVRSTLVTSASSHTTSAASSASGGSSGRRAASRAGSRRRG